MAWASDYTPPSNRRAFEKWITTGRSQAETKEEFDARMQKRRDAFQEVHEPLIKWAQAMDGDPKKTPQPLDFSGDSNLAEKQKQAVIDFLKKHENTRAFSLRDNTLNPEHLGKSALRALDELAGVQRESALEKSFQSLSKAANYILNPRPEAIQKTDNSINKVVVDPSTPSMQAEFSYNQLTDFVAKEFGKRGFGDRVVEFDNALPGEADAVKKFFMENGYDEVTANAALVVDEKDSSKFKIFPKHLPNETKRALRTEARELKNNSLRSTQEPQGMVAEDVMALAFRDGGDAKFNSFKNVSAQDFKEVEAFLKENNCLGALNPATYEAVQKNGGRITIETKELSREAKTKLSQRAIEIGKERQQPKAEVEKPEPKAEAEKKGPQKSYDGKEMLALAYVVKATDKGSKPTQEFSNVTKDDYDKTVAFLKEHNAMGALKPQKYENIQKNDGKYTIDYSKMDDKARQELIETAREINPKAVNALENKMGRHKNEVVADIIEARKDILSLYNNSTGIKATLLAAPAIAGVVALAAAQPVAWLIGKVVNGLGLTGEDEVQRNTVQKLANELNLNLPENLIKSAEPDPKSQAKPKPKKEPQTQNFEEIGHKAPAAEQTTSQSTPAVEASIRQTPCERVAKFLDRRINNQAAQATDNEINYDKAIKFPYMDEAAVNKVKKTLVESGMKPADVDKAVTFASTDGRSKGRMEIKFSEIPPEALKKLHEKGTVEGRARESAIEAVKSMKEFQANDVSGGGTPSAGKAASGQRSRK